MVSLKTVQASNAGLRALPNITALFVGGTSGIGQSTLRQLARYADSPTAYIIGRNEARARPFLSELQQLNPKGRFHFIEADVSLVRNVDDACQQILQQQKKLNFLFMTPGGISLGGRNGMQTRSVYGIPCANKKIQKPSKASTTSPLSATTPGCALFRNSSRCWSRQGQAA